MLSNRLETDTERITPRDGFKIEFTKLLGVGWTPFVNHLLASTYMHNLMVFLYEIYNIEHKGSIFPLYQDLFENFRSCSFMDTRLVILGKEPFNNINSTGIPFGNPSNPSGPVEPDSILMERCIKKTIHKGASGKYYDETMYTWATQGVLLLDSASTALRNKENAHKLYWRHFTREILRTLSIKKNDIIFLLLGKEASYFRKYIDDSKHTVYTYCHPSDMAKQNKDWNCPYFPEINEKIIKKYGEEKKIYW